MPPRLTYENNGYLITFGNNQSLNYQNAIECIDRHIENDRPIIVGVNHTIGGGINEGKGLPTVKGNPNNPLNYNPDGTLKPINEHIVDEIFFHKGNYARPSLSTNIFRNGQRVYISEGCQTGGSRQGSLLKYREFIQNAKGFNGLYYLRAKPILTETIK